MTDVRQDRRRLALRGRGRGRQAGAVTSSPALDVSGLTVRYGDTIAVDSLDLSIPAGQTVALLGPNGAGKSTVVNAVLGLVPDRRPARSRCSAVVRGTRSGPGPSARCCSTAACPARPASARCSTWSGAASRPPGRSTTWWPPPASTGCSPGRSTRSPAVSASASCSPWPWPARRRCCCSTSRRRPWTSKGAGPSGRRCAGWPRRGHTVVFATHHLDEADAVADRVVVVAGGRVVADGSAAQIKAGTAGPHHLVHRRRRRPARRPARGHRARPPRRRRHADHQRPGDHPAGAARRRAPAAGPRGPRRQPRGRRPLPHPTDRSRPMNPLFAFQLRRVARNRQFLFFTVLLPALFTVFFTKIFGGQAVERGGLPGRRGGLHGLDDGLRGHRRRARRDHPDLLRPGLGLAAPAAGDAGAADARSSPSTSPSGRC